MVSRIKLYVFRHIICHPVTVNPPKNRRNRKICNQELIYVSERFNYICAVNRNRAISYQLLVKNAFSDACFKFIGVRKT